jgi:SSS family solute:Na+ symporter
MKLGGYGNVFRAAGDAFMAKGGATGLTLKPGQMLPLVSLALGSAMAAFMYSHTLTGIFAARSAGTIRKNAVFLLAYTVLLGLIALLPSCFSGFAFAAIDIGALVPAAVMSIGAASLFTRNFWKAYVWPDIAPAGEATVAKIASLVVKGGALVFILLLPT